MHDYLGHHPREEEPEETDRKPEARPIVPILQHLQRIPLEFYQPVKVHLLERLQWDFIPAFIPHPMLVITKLQIMLHWPPRIPRFLILARGDPRGDSPECHEDREEGQEGEEEPCEEAAAEFEGQVPGDGGAEAKEEDIGEGLATGGVGGEGAVLDGGVLEEDISARMSRVGTVGKVLAAQWLSSDLRWWCGHHSLLEEARVWARRVSRCIRSHPMSRIPISTSRMNRNSEG